MKTLLLTGIVFSAVLRGQGKGQEERTHALALPTATVRVVAYGAKGRYLGAPNVSRFIDAGGQRNLAPRFHDGVATGIPYGVYQIEGRLPAYYSDARYVRIYQPSVTIVLGLRFGEELPQTPPTLPGRVIGLEGPVDKSFTKLIGVYDNVSMESPIDGDGRFTLGGLAPGLFILLIVSDRGILASRTLSFPYEGPPLEIEIRRDQQLFPGKAGQQQLDH